ncbi:tetratricopeptide repeat protein [Roseovarius salis]|uniref:tetratricopeptide repeat protein n=1 Tax=Roseovarius salis TaxID=3376063 RepID=UPI0037CC7B0B
MDEQRLDRLHAELLEAEPGEARRIAKEIEMEWSSSGSPAMDLLLKRGTDALEAGETRVAIEHFTALTDHAPEFAEGWNRRATAFARAGLLGPAVADLGRALTIRPRHFGALASLGAILSEVNKPGMALDAFRRALEIHPHHADVNEAVSRLDSRVGGTDL